MGYLMTLPSARAEFGIVDQADALMGFEAAVFTVLPAVESSAQDGENILFGDKVRFCSIYDDFLAWDSHGATSRMVKAQPGSKTNRESLAATRWRILPRFDVRGNGERVFDGDSVVFQQAGEEEAYLTFSNERDACSSYEATLTPHSQEELQILLYDESVGEAALRTTDCVLLFHRECHAFLEPSVSSSSVAFLSGDVADVGSWVGARGVILLENSDVRTGGALICGQPFRLRDVDSDCYYYVAPKERVASSGPRSEDAASFELLLAPISDVDSGNSLFTFHSAGLDEGTPMRNMSRGFFFSPACAVWIGAGESSDGKSYPVIGSTALCQRDGLQICQISPVACRQMQTIKRLLGPIKDFAELSASRPLVQAELSLLCANLDGLRRLCKKGGTLTGNENLEESVVSHSMQRQMSAHRVPSMCLALIRSLEQAFNLHESSASMGRQIPLKNNSTESDMIREVVHNCFSLIKLVACDNNVGALTREDALYISTFFDDDVAVDCLAGALHGNEELVGNEADFALLESALGCFVETPTCSLLHLLTSLVACDGMGFCAQQNYACQRLFKDRNIREQTWFSFTYGGDGLQVAYPSANSANKVSRPISVISSEAARKEKDAASTLHFLELQLEFFSSLCRGRNTYCTVMVHELVSPSVIVSALRERSIPPAIRGGLLQLAAASLVEVDGAVDVVERMKRLWYVVDSPQPVNIEERVSPEQDELKKCVMLQFRQTNGILSPNDTVMGATLELCGALLRHGFYGGDEYATLAHSLALVLDGRTDVCGCKNRFLESQEMLSVISTKRKRPANPQHVGRLHCSTRGSQGNQALSRK